MFLADVGGLGYPQKHAGRAPIRHKGREAIRQSAQTSEDVLMSEAMSDANPLLAPMKGTQHREVGTVQLDIAAAGAARIKRVIYPPGFRRSKDMKPVTGTDLCMHAHAGFLASGQIHIEYEDGCIVEFSAPQVVVIDPGHDGWVVGNEPAVLIEFDFENDTVRSLGMADRHKHGD
jgi:hypothetical protein